MEHLKHNDVSDEIVIRYSWFAGTMLGCLGAAAMIAISVLRFHSALGIFYALVFLVPIMALPRRKLVIGPEVVTYRPAIGSAKMTRFTQIASISQEYALRPGGAGVPAARLTLKDGMAVSIPLDLPDHEVVFNRILKNFHLYNDAQTPTKWDPGSAFSSRT